MERTEDGGHAGLLQAEEHVGNFVNIAYELFVGFGFRIPGAVRRAGGVSKALGKVKFSVFLVVARLGVERVNLVAGILPVPGEGRNTALLPQVLGGIESHLRVALVPGVASLHAGCEQEVETHEGGIFSRVLVERCYVGEFLDGGGADIAGHHAGNGLYAVIRGKEVVKLLGAFGSVSCNWAVADGSASGSCCSKTECENGFSEFHDNSYIVRLENRLKKGLLKAFFEGR